LQQLDNSTNNVAKSGGGMAAMQTHDQDAASNSALAEPGIIYMTQGAKNNQNNQSIVIENFQMSNSQDAHSHYTQYISGVELHELMRYGMSEFPHRSDNLIHF